MKGGTNMIELKINFKYFKLEMLIGEKGSLINPWHKVEESVRADKGDEVAEEHTLPKNAYQEDYSDEKDYGNYLESSPTQITELAEKYHNELLNKVSPPKPSSQGLDTYNNRASASSSVAFDPTFFETNMDGLYELSKEDHLSEQFEDLPDVEIIDDEYETGLMRATKLANQRYLAYKESHGIE